MKRNISLERRAEIGQEKRARTRAEILAAAFELVGREHGRSTRIDEVCAQAHVSRGTFYNYFSSVDELFDALGYEISHHLNVTLRGLLDQMRPAERVSSAVRYYLIRAGEDRAWGRAMVNLTGTGPIFGANTVQHTRSSIEEGVALGEFTVTNVDIATDMLSGTVLASMISVINDHASPSHSEQVARQVLLALHVEESTIERLVTMALPITLSPLARTTPLSSTPRKIRRTARPALKSVG